MIFGFQLQLWNILAGGVVVLTLVILTMLVGLRIIKFKGRTHLKVHKTLAWTVAVVGGVHGTLGLVYLEGWKLFS